MGKVHELKDLELLEVSLVDYPANKGARVSIWKRDFSPDERESLAERGLAMPDGSFPIVTREDLANAIQAIGRAKMPGKAKKHIVARARALGALDMLPEEWAVNKREEDFSTGDGGSERVDTTHKKAGSSGEPRKMEQDDMSVNILKGLDGASELPEDVVKAINTAAQAAVTGAVEKAREEANAELSAKEDAIKALEAKLEKATGEEVDPIEKALTGVDEKVKKALDPILKEHEALKAKVAKQETETAMAEIKKALGDVASDELAKAVHNVAVGKSDQADADEIMKALAALKKQADAGGLLKEHGTSATTGGEAANEIEQLAKELVSKGEAHDIHTARATVRKANRELAAREKAERQTNLH